jgi:hypothetical protein
VLDQSTTGFDTQETSPADAVADETAKLMGEAQATGEVVPLRGA